MSETPKRRYEPVVTKEFRSTIPPHLLDKLSDTERYMVQALSKLENQYEWVVQSVVNDNKNIIDLGGRCDAIETWRSTVETDTKGQVEKVDEIWKWKQMTSGKWAVVGALVLIVIPIALKFLLDLVVKKGP